MSNDAFFTTRWTRVARSQGDSEEAKLALSELCEAYYDPVHGFILATIRNDEKARDLTQGFFATVLGKSAFDGADPDRGRFRAFLLGAVKHFLSKQYQKDQTAKRGGDMERTNADIHQLPAAPDDSLQFDRDWANALILRAHAALEREMTEAGNQHHFEILRPFLDGGPQSSREDACKALGFRMNALNVAIHRLRERFRNHVRAEVAATTADPTSIQDEFRHLLAVLMQSA